MIRVLACIGLVACGTNGDRTNDPQIPPRGDRDLSAWLDAGYYLAWRCQPDRHMPQGPSPHPSARICSNELIYAASGDAPYAVGAATVKELYDGDAITGFAVSHKVAADSPGGWYWYEANPAAVVDGTGAPVCLECHVGAAHDYVWTMAP